MNRPQDDSYSAEDLCKHLGVTPVIAAEIFTDVLLTNRLKFFLSEVRRRQGPRVELPDRLDPEIGRWFYYAVLGINLEYYYDYYSIAAEAQVHQFWHDQVVEFMQPSRLNPLLDQLDKRQRDILMMNWRLDGRQNRSIYDIGKAFGLGPEAARQACKIALKRLRQIVKVDKANQLPLLERPVIALGLSDRAYWALTQRYYLTMANCGI